MRTLCSFEDISLEAQLGVQTLLLCVADLGKEGSFTTLW